MFECVKMFEWTHKWSHHRSGVLLSKSENSAAEAGSGSLDDQDIERPTRSRWVLLCLYTLGFQQLLFLSRLPQETFHAIWKCRFFFSPQKPLLHLRAVWFSLSFNSCCSVVCGMPNSTQQTNFCILEAFESSFSLPATCSRNFWSQVSIIYAQAGLNLAHFANHCVFFVGCAFFDIPETSTTRHHMVSHRDAIARCQENKHLWCNQNSLAPPHEVFIQERVEIARVEPLDEGYKKVTSQPWTCILNRNLKRHVKWLVLARSAQICANPLASSSSIKSHVLLLLVAVTTCHAKAWFTTKCSFANSRPSHVVLRTHEPLLLHLPSEVGMLMFHTLSGSTTKTPDDPWPGLMLNIVSTLYVSKKRYPVSAISWATVGDLDVTRLPRPNYCVKCLLWQPTLN